MVASECYSPYREGYFMNAEEQRKAKGAALLEYTEAKERRALLENEAAKLAQHFESLATLLRERPETIVFGDADAVLLKEYKRFAALIDDLKITRAELQRLDSVVRGLGITHFLDKN
jgi:hypothetical protein